MIRLEIRRPNGEVYWTEHFNTQEEADKWLAEERTRRYWRNEFTHEFTSIGPTQQEIEEQRQEAERLLQVRQNRIDRLKLAFRNADTLTANQLRQAVKDIIGVLATLED